MQRLLKNRLFLWSFVMLGAFISTNSFSQSGSEELNTVLACDFRNPRFEPYKPEFMLPANKNVIIRYNPVTLIFGSMMYAYQSYFSLQFSAGCLYEPTCSHMSKEYIREFGLLKGVFVSADRLTRCNRLASAQIHPIRINPLTGKVNESTRVYRFNHSKNCNHAH